MRRYLTAIIAMVFMAAGASATVCDLPSIGGGCSNMQGWGADPGIGSYGGRDPGDASHDFSLVVEPGNCVESARTASIDIDGTTVTLEATGPFWTSCDTYGQLAVNWVELDGSTIRVRHLDGLGTDSFDVEVYVNNQYVCSYTDQGNSVEIWKTTECGMPTPAPEFASIAVAVAVLLTTPAFAYLVVRKRN